MPEQVPGAKPVRDVTHPTGPSRNESHHDGEPQHNRSDDGERRHVQADGTDSRELWRELPDERGDCHHRDENARDSSEHGDQQRFRQQLTRDAR